MNSFLVVMRQIHRMYPESGLSDRMWTEADVVDVFRTFYERYEYEFECPHPRLTNKTILSVMQSLPEDSAGMAYEFEEYPDLIEQYFAQDFGSQCDYSIAHFVSGDIRLYRSYEAYGYRL